MCNVSCVCLSINQTETGYYISGYMFFGEGDKQKQKVQRKQIDGERHVTNRMQNLDPMHDRKMKATHPLLHLYRYT